MMERVRVAIVGGYGGMGQIFVRLFKSEGCEVVIAGPTEAKGIKAGKELGVEYSRDNVKAATGADVVVVTVPIDVTFAVITEVAPHVKSGGMIMDLTSVKEAPCRLMAEKSGSDVEVVGTHPIFGPRVVDIEGQVLVLTPVRGAKWVAWLRGILEKHKARVIESTAEEHDMVMAVVQGLTHFTYISVAETLREIGFDVKRSRQFASPVYDLMLDMIGRIVGQDPRLYAEIQMNNPHVLDVHKVYLETAGRLSETVKAKDERRFVEEMISAARHFDDVERAMGRSDKAISSLVSELKALKESVGRELLLQHIYSGTKHYGVVVSVTADEVVLEDKGKKSTLKLSNLRILGAKELAAFKKEKFGVVSRDYSVVLNEEADENFIRELLREHDPNVDSVAVADVFRSDRLGAGKKSVLFKVQMINEDVKRTQARLAEFFKRIGGVLR